MRVHSLIYDNALHEGCKMPNRRLAVVVPKLEISLGEVITNTGATAGQGAVGFRPCPGCRQEPQIHQGVRRAAP
jgi:hypothetical protein